MRDDAAVSSTTSVSPAARSGAGLRVLRRDQGVELREGQPVALCRARDRATRRQREEPAPGAARTRGGVRGARLWVTLSSAIGFSTARRRAMNGAMRNDMT